MRISIYFILAIFLISCGNEMEIESNRIYEEAMSAYKAQQYDPALSKLEIVFRNIEDDQSELALKALYLRGFIYYLRDENKIAFQNYLEAIDIAEKLGDQLRIPRLYNEVGQIFYEKDMFEQSLFYYRYALDNSGQSTYQDIAFYNYGVGKSLRRLNRLDEGLEYFIKAIEINKDLNNFNALANNYLELGLLQQMAGNQGQALKHFNEIISISKLSNNADLYQWKAYNNIGNIHLIADELKSAEYYFKKSLEFDNDDSQLSVTYNNLGKICNKKGDYKLALNYFKKSLKYNSKKLELNELLITNNALNQTFEKLNQPDSLLHYTLIINNMALPAIETRSWLTDEDEKIALLTKYQEYERNKAEREQYAKTSWLMAFIMTFIFVSGVLSVRLYKIYHYRSQEKGLALIKNSNEMVYLLDMFRKEKEEMKRSMDQKIRN